MTPTPSRQLSAANRPLDDLIAVRDAHRDVLFRDAMPAAEDAERPESAKTRITDIRPAGQDHQVVTVTSDTPMGYRRKPCSNCPWRVDAIGQFPAEAFRHSANTAYDMAGSEFACHQSGQEKPATCAGFLLRGSAHNLATRMKAMRGRIDFNSISDDGVELFNSYRAMAEANGVSPDDPVLSRCRD